MARVAPSERFRTQLVKRWLVARGGSYRLKDRDLGRVAPVES